MGVTAATNSPRIGGPPVGLMRPPSGLSPPLALQQQLRLPTPPPFIVRQVGEYTIAERLRRIKSYLDKRQRRTFNKRVKYACRKNLADSRPRVGGRFVKRD